MKLESSISLLVLAIFSLILIIIIEFEWGFIPSTYYKQLNSVGEILSSGYLGGYVVYYLTVKMPQNRDFKKTRGVRKKMYIEASYYITGHLVAAIRGGIIKNEELSTDNLQSYIKDYPLYEKFIDAQEEETLCQRIWIILSLFQDKIMEFISIWGHYLNCDDLSILGEIVDSDFYRCMNENFSFYNNKPIINPKNGKKTFLKTVLNKPIAIDEDGYNEVVKSLIENLIKLTDNLILFRDRI